MLSEQTSDLEQILNGKQYGKLSLHKSEHINVSIIKTISQYISYLQKVS